MYHSVVAGDPGLIFNGLNHPSVWASPSVGREPYTWRRPVPGWRQSEESVTLENRGYDFEEAEFEAHFRDQGKEAWV